MFRASHNNERETIRKLSAIPLGRGEQDGDARRASFRKLAVLVKGYWFSEARIALSEWSQSLAAATLQERFGSELVVLKRKGGALY